MGVLVGAALVFLLWWSGFGLSLREAFYKSMTFLVVASPCTLVLSIPSAILAGIAWGARHGVLFRGGSAIEELAGVDLVALDKTGTLTAGRMKVLRVESFPPGREDELLEVAAPIEKDSNHPIARAIVKYGGEKEVATLKVEKLKSLTGKGIQAEIEGVEYVLGKRELIDRDDLVGQLGERSFESTEVWVSGDGLLGCFFLEDEIRKESCSVMDHLRARGIVTAMLTGDNPGAARPVAKELGIEEVHAGLYPGEKVELIRRYMEEGRKVAMVGDGVNDAPSLAAAHVSVTMGGRGSDAALEQAEVVLVNDRIQIDWKAPWISVRGPEKSFTRIWPFRWGRWWSWWWRLW